MFSQRMDVFSIHTHRLSKSIQTLYKIEKSFYWDDGYEAKNVHAYIKR